MYIISVRCRDILCAVHVQIYEFSLVAKLTLDIFRIIREVLLIQLIQDPKGGSKNFKFGSSFQGIIIRIGSFPSDKYWLLVSIYHYFSVDAQESMSMDDVDIRIIVTSTVNFEIPCTVF